MSHCSPLQGQLVAVWRPDRVQSRSLHAIDSVIHIGPAHHDDHDYNNRSLCAVTRISVNGLY
jgi:hypothetical protein